MKRSEVVRWLRPKDALGLLRTENVWGCSPQVLWSWGCLTQWDVGWLWAALQRYD